MSDSSVLRLTSSPVAYTVLSRTRRVSSTCQLGSPNEDNTVQTTPVELTLWRVTNNETVKMVVVNNKAEKLLNWYENKVLEYAVYDGKAVTTPLSILMKKDNEVLQRMYQKNTRTQTKMQYTLTLEVETIDNSDFTALIDSALAPTDECVCVMLFLSCGQLARLLGYCWSCILLQCEKQKQHGY